MLPVPNTKGGVFGNILVEREPSEIAPMFDFEAPFIAVERENER